ADLKIATAYVCPLGGQEGENAIALLAKNKSEIRRVISKELTLKYVPDIRFRLDETYDRMDETKLLFSLDKVKRDLDM
ncbi:MAG: ribosome-binding factor A, partial [Paracoccaceae bacterium]